MVYTLFLVNFLYIFIITYFLFSIRNEVKKLKNNSTDNSVDVDDEQLSSYELERMRREEEFDKRINRLKSEISHQDNTDKRKGEVADELHPYVKNLPHNAVNAYEIPSDVEYSE